MTQQEVANAINGAFGSLSGLKTWQLYDHWISVLYEANGDMAHGQWTEQVLRQMEQDVMEQMTEVAQ